MGPLGEALGLSALYNDQYRSLAQQMGLQQQMTLAGAYGIGGTGYTAGSGVAPSSVGRPLGYEKAPDRNTVLKKPNSEWLDMRVNEMRVRL